MKTRSFYSKKCGYKFIKQHAVSVEKCPKCEEPVIDVNIKYPFPYITLSDSRILSNLDAYSRMKYQWYKYPKSWVYNIQKQRELENLSVSMNPEDKPRKVFMKDSFGDRIGEMPQPQGI